VTDGSNKGVTTRVHLIDYVLSGKSTRQVLLYDRDCKLRSQCFLVKRHLVVRRAMFAILFIRLILITWNAIAKT